VALGGDGDPRKRVGGFSNTSYEAVSQRIKQFGLSGTVTLARGYFHETLPQYADSLFCFVHLDCVIYESYRQCLAFFYPRMVAGGVILLDEYRDPPWPGCTQAVDEFVADKPEKVAEIRSDNHIKYYLRKL
jgi:O-methyltransferase